MLCRRRRYEFQRQSSDSDWRRSGIGRAPVELLSSRGAAVAILDIDEAGRELAATITASGGRAEFFHVNVGQSNKVEEAINAAHQLFGRIDILVVSAGMQRYGTAVTTTDEEWALVLGVNLSGAFYAARACLPFMKAERRVNRKCIVGAGAGHPEQRLLIYRQQTRNGRIDSVDGDGFCGRTKFALTPSVPELSIRRCCAESHS